MAHNDFPFGILATDELKEKVSALLNARAKFRNAIRLFKLEQFFAA